MEIIDIGTAFKVLTLAGKDGLVFDPSNKPICRLHNKQQSKYYEAYPQDVNINVDINTCDVDWSAGITEKMIPGIYNLDVYLNDGDDMVMLYHKEDYAKARIVSVSPGQSSGTQEEQQV